jgi:Co/Zn/Cd efflux system component
MRARSAAAVLKRTSLSLMAACILGMTTYHVFVTEPPKAGVMGAIGVFALLANLTSVMFLIRYKDGDANVRSVWLCSRNDAFGNIAVMIAALGVWGTASG